MVSISYDDWARRDYIDEDFDLLPDAMDRLNQFVKEFEKIDSITVTIRTQRNQMLGAVGKLRSIF